MCFLNQILCSLFTNSTCWQIHYTNVQQVPRSSLLYTNNIQTIYIISWSHRHCKPCMKGLGLAETIYLALLIQNQMSKTVKRPSKLMRHLYDIEKTISNQKFKHNSAIKPLLCTFKDQDIRVLHLNSFWSWCCYCWCLKKQKQRQKHVLFEPKIFQTYE